MERRHFCISLCLAVAAVGIGCQDEAMDYRESDVNAYLCRVCGEKFFTPVKVFAEHCPGKKHQDIEDVMGFIYEDGSLAIGTQSNGPMFGKKQAKIRTNKLPREKELLGFGFKKVTAAEVMANPPK